MANLKIHKMHGCHNYFYVIDETTAKIIPENQKSIFVKWLCTYDPEYPLDTVLFLSNSRCAEIKMTVFDKNGSEESMCGNGIRCAAKFFFDNLCNNCIDDEIKIETLSGIKYVKQDKSGYFHVNMGIPNSIKRMNDFYFVNTGCPHIVKICDDAGIFKKTIGIKSEMKKLAHDKEICSQLHIDPDEGIYVNYVLLNKHNEIQVLTYERHIEDITNACGTGNTAAGLILNKMFNIECPIQLKNIGGTIIINILNNNVIMTGPAEYLGSIIIIESILKKLKNRYF